MNPPLSHIPIDRQAAGTLSYHFIKVINDFQLAINRPSHIFNVRILLDVMIHAPHRQYTAAMVILSYQIPCPM